jgi:hypothetical protein
MIILILDFLEIQFRMVKIKNPARIEGGVHFQVVPFVRMVTSGCELRIIYERRLAAWHTER